MGKANLRTCEPFLRAASPDSFPPKNPNKETMFCYGEMILQRTANGDVCGRLDLSRTFGSGRTALTKFVLPFQKSRQNLSLPNFQFVKRGRTEKQQNNVNYKCQSHEKKKQQYGTTWLLSCTCTRLTRMVCIWMCIWSVCIYWNVQIKQYLAPEKQLNVNWGTMIVVFLVRIIPRYESFIFTV